MILQTYTHTYMYIYTYTYKTHFAFGPALCCLMILALRYFDIT